MYVVYSPDFLNHSLGQSHPECPRRLQVVLDYLNSSMKYELAIPSPAPEEDLLAVHTKGHLESLRRLSKTGASFSDNVFSERTYEIATLAAGAATEAALLSEKAFAYAHVRPPGHHAGRDFFGGFCYINNIACAIRRAQKNGAKRALIVDFDLHHGNGTQDIFKEDGSVFYLSFNQDPSVTYPGSGFEHENSGHIRNVVVPDGATEGEYVDIFERNLELAFEAHAPDIIGVSAGFDTYSLDPVGSRIRILEPSTYNQLGKAIGDCGVRTFAVLEGGYYLPVLGQNVYEFLSAFGGG